MLVAPLDALTDGRLTDPERRVLLALFSFRGEAGEQVFPARETLAQRANIEDETRVSKITGSLVKKGWIEKKRRGFTGGNIYTLFDSPKVDCESTMEPQTTMDCDTTSKVDCESTSKVACESTNNYLTNEQTNYLTNTPKPPKGDDDGSPAWFDSFAERLWKIYPKKTDKKKSIAQLRKMAGKKKSRTILAGLLNHVRLRKRIKPNGQYWPTLDRMIRDEKFRDQIPGLGLCPLQVINLYHKRLPSNPQCVALDDRVLDNLAAMWERAQQQGGYLWFDRYFKYCAIQPGLTGGRNGWRADIGFITSREKFSAIANGAYSGGDTA